MTWPTGSSTGQDWPGNSTANLTVCIRLPLCGRETALRPACPVWHRRPACRASAASGSQETGKTSAAPSSQQHKSGWASSSPIASAVYLDRSLAGRKMQPPRRAIARHVGRRTVYVDEPPAATVISRMIFPPPSNNSTFVADAGSRKRLWSAGLAGAGSTRRRGGRSPGARSVPDAFRPYDPGPSRSVPRAVRREPPNRFFAIAVLRHADVQDKNALPHDLRDQPRLLDRPGPLPLARPSSGIMASLMI